MRFPSFSIINGCIFKYYSKNWLGHANFYNNNIIGRMGKFEYIYDSYYYVQLVDLHDPNVLSWEKFSLT